MSLLIMPTDRILSKDRLSPSWMRRSISWRKKSPQESDSQLSTDSTLLSPHSTTSRTNSDESRSTQLTKSGNSSAFRGVVNRLRSSSSASSLGGKSQGTDFNDIHDWFQGFRSYNQLVTKNISNQQSYNSQEFTNTTKALTKNCGGRILHGLPEGAFDFSLLWCPASQGTKRESGEPSWSWTAHEGQVIFPFDPTTCPDVYTAPKIDGEIFRSEIVHFHVGPKDAQYTVRREKGGTLRTKYPPYFHAPRGSEINVESNTLRFTASTISADDFVVEQLEYQGKSIPCSQLMDEENKQCGVIMDFESTLSEPSALGPFEFVLLSRNLRREPASHTRKPANPTIHPPGTPIWDGECFVWDQEVVEFDEEVFENGPWKMLNVMLIKWVGEHAERVAIARIHESAWLAKSPVRKEIVLR